MKWCFVGERELYVNILFLILNDEIFFFLAFIILDDIIFNIGFFGLLKLNISCRMNLVIKGLFNLWMRILLVVIEVVCILISILLFLGVGFLIFVNIKFLVFLYFKYLIVFIILFLSCYGSKISCIVC